MLRGAAAVAKRHVGGSWPPPRDVVGSRAISIQQGHHLQQVHHSLAKQDAYHCTSHDTTVKKVICNPVMEDKITGWIRGFSESTWEQVGHPP